MTGIERLRRLAGSQDMGNAWTAMLANELTDIADQIEREADVETVRSDAMKAWRWVRKLGGLATLQLHEETFADMMRQRDEYRAIARDYERDATWVREHGGLDAVKRRWECLSYYADPVPRSCMEKRLARLQRQIDESHAALRRRNARIGFLVSELNRANNENHEEFMRRAGDYTEFTDEVCKRLATELRYVEGCSKDVMDAALDALDRRLMPEGMEWPTVDGKPVDFVTGYEPSLGVLEAVSIYSNGACEVMGHDGIIKNVKEIHVATPEALGALEVPCKVGDTVWVVNDPYEKLRVVGFCKDGDIKLSTLNDGIIYRSPDVLTHRAPVPASDGRPLREGETVWDVSSGIEFTVIGLPMPGEYQAVRLRLDDGAVTGLDPDRLTHTKPEIDTWERIEEDARLEPPKYADRYRIGRIGFEAEDMRVDLVRRARALAERGQ